MRADDPPVRQRFTIAHEIGHFLLHSHLLDKGEIIDRFEPGRRELYRSNLSTSLEARASRLAVEILMPWNLLGPLIYKRLSELQIDFQVSREVVDIRLATPTARRLKYGVRVDPAVEAEFRTLVDRWHKDTQYTSSPKRMITHPSYRRIVIIGTRLLPLLFQELNERPDHWLVALNAITKEDPAREGSTFKEAVNAWLSWGREPGVSEIVRDPDLDREFPGLVDAEYEIKSPYDPRYNCIAFAVGDLQNFWYDANIKGYYWPPGVGSADTIEGWTKAFSIHGYFATEDRGLEPGFEKIAIYGKSGGPEHVARRKASGV